MQILERIGRAASARVRGNAKQISKSIDMYRAGVPLAAEPVAERLIARLQRKASLSRDEAEAVARGMWVGAGRRKPGDAERVYGNSIDFVGVSFLERGRIASRAVGRVAFHDGRAQGTGFLVSEQLFLTNHHVIQNEAACGSFVVEFEYELDLHGNPVGVSRFALDPSAFFASAPETDLDFTLVALGARVGGTRDLAHLGSCPLSIAPDKHALGEVANVIQHPDGRYKEVVLRENHLVSRLERVLHYVADTEPGASGSPVFNNEWQVIALHHWGSPWLDQQDSDGRWVPREVNEGIRVSSIVQDLSQRMPNLSAPRRALLQAALRAGERSTPGPIDPGSQAYSSVDPELGPDGEARWTIPLEICVRVPSLGRSPTGAASNAPADGAPATDGAPDLGEAALRPSQDFSDRAGYKPRFLTGHPVELPRLSSAQERIAARNQDAGAGDDPFELKYHHFSIVMNRDRRLAFFTACNIDGASAKHVDRKKGTVTALDPTNPQHHLNERLEDLEGAEASEGWYDEPRLDPDEYAGRDIYEQQVVRGYLDTRSMNRTLRMFQRGHLVRRMDPAWGTPTQARLADADTFHWTNCSPQVGFFNMGMAGPNPGGGRLWRGVENFVLRNAAAENARASVFTGPVFAARDRAFRDIHVPGRFWKIVVWAEGGDLRALAMLADQRPLIRIWPEALGEAGAEAFSDPDELSKVHDFLSTIAEIERLTKLDFGDAVRTGDIRAGERALRVRDFEEIGLAPRRRRRTRGKAKRAKATRPRRS